MPEAENVPASISTNCGEEHVDKEITGRLLEAAGAAAGVAIQVHIEQYMAAQALEVI